MTSVDEEQETSGKGETRPSGATQITSIERLFSAIINTCKLSGGYPFKHRDARLMIAYRIALVFLSRFLRIIYFTPLVRYQDTITQDSSFKTTVGIFNVLYTSSELALNFSSIITGAIHYQTMSLVLRKKLDVDYLRPISSWSQRNRPSRSGAHNRQQWQPALCNPNGIILSKGTRAPQLVQQLIEFKSDKSLFRIDEVILVRLLIVLAIALTAIVTFVREEYGNHLIASSHFDRSLRVAPGDQMGWSQRNGTLSHATERHLSYLYLIRGSSFISLGRQIAFDMPLVWMAHVSLAVLEFFQGYGNISLCLMSTACMTEVLKRVGEQESARVVRERGLTSGPEIEHRRAACASIRARAKSESSSRDSSPGPLIQTTELLVHVRDVLVALRSALMLDYLFATIFDVCRLITVFGSIVTLLNAHRLGWALIMALVFIRINITTIACRLSYHRLHAEANRIKSLIYERLVHSSINSSGLVGSFEAGSRIETITNYRLAKEIEELWPTDWLVPDIKSCISQNFLVVTFVATLEQLK